MNQHLRSVAPVVALLAMVCVTLSTAAQAQNLQALLSTPKASFDATPPPPAPDYDNDDAWAALPGKDSNANFVPRGVGAHDNQATAKADVFFLHPTTYNSGAGWNGRYDEPGAAKTTIENVVMPDQASVFNGCCRIFAPHYRQASFYSYFQAVTAQNPNAEKALDLAYQDAARAFDEFIAKRNRGRPFIIASHSQGSLHAMRILQEKIAGTPLAKRMIAAYLVGFSIPSDMAIEGMGPCRTPTQTGCYLTWNSASRENPSPLLKPNNPIWLDGRYQPLGERKVLCVNPLTWTEDGMAPASADLGGLSTGPSLSEDTIVPGVTGAECSSNGLIITPPKQPGFTANVAVTSYHRLDYDLYYMNIRANAAERTAAFLAQH